MRSALLIFAPFLSFAQLSDSFSDGDFTNNPTWSGNDSSFSITAAMLQSNGPQASSTIYLSTSSSLIDSTEWNFLVKLDFNPSSTNLVKIYLVSDQMDLSGSLNGYFVQFGESGTAPDSLDVFVQNGTTATKIFTGITGMMTSSSSNSIRVKIIRHSGGSWDVFADKTGGTNFSAEGSFTDTTVTTTFFFGVVCKYSTASRYNLYNFDDFSISHIVADTTKPQVTSITVLSSTTLDLKFSEAVEINSAQTTTNYSVDNSVGNPSSATRDGNDFSLVHLTFPSAFATSVDYKLTISGVKDLSNNIIPAVDTGFILADSALPNDIVINEILFNPKSGGYDFIELYNRSSRVIDLSQLEILELDISDPQNILEQSVISTLPYLLFPQEFVVLTENPENIQQNYFVPNPNALIEVPLLPNFPDDRGICGVHSRNSITIDSLSFDHDWHFPLLDVEDGVSLERIDYNKPTNDKNNWHSAASTVGFATPTYQNSQFAETGITDDQITIEPPVFTPDNDGEKDFATIIYKFSEPGYVLNAKVYDARGREIRNLIRNELLSSEGSFLWDGIDNDNQKARIGIYLLYLEVFNLQGKVKKFKKTVVLGAKLN